MRIEVKSIAFGMSRYSTRWHLDGATWKERRAASGKNFATACCAMPEQPTKDSPIDEQPTPTQTQGAITK
jgi:hypothetical protein